MEALLILGGLLLILAGLVWLVVLAFGTSLLWGLGSLIPPLTLAFVVRHWRVARKALMLSALGFIPLVVGFALLASQDSQRLAAILELRWLERPAEQVADVHIQLGGELHGEACRPQHGEVLDGLLSLREGQDFFAQREIRIRLPYQVTGPLLVDVLPDDSGELPEVEVSWLLPGQELPEARRLSSGYTLHLNLVPQAPNKLVGDFHLVLPPRFATTLSGKVELLRSGLRQQHGRIDYRFDSRDTLAQVVGDHLRRRFATDDVRLAPLPPVRFPASQLTLAVDARIDGTAQRLSLPLRKHAEHGWHVASDPLNVSAGAAAAASASTSANGSMVPGSAAAQPPSKVAARPAGADSRFSLVLLISEPERYIGRSMRIALVRGGSAEGVFTGLIDDGLIRLQRNMRAADAAVFVFHPDEIAHIELIEY